MRVVCVSAALAMVLPMILLTSLNADVRPSPNKTIEKSPQTTRCASLLKECFSYDGEERSECFHAAASHAFCLGQRIGEIAFKRWAASPDYIASPEGAAMPFLGPQLVDRACLSNFDNTFSSELIRGSPDLERIDWLSRRLDACFREPSEEMFIP